MHWRSVKTIPLGVFFNCAGNPTKLILPICSCANTYEKHLINYKRYKYHEEFYIELGMIRTKSEIPGYWNYSPTKSFNYPKKLRDSNDDELCEFSELN